MDPRRVLEFYLLAGADESIGETPRNRYAEEGGERRSDRDSAPERAEHARPGSAPSPAHPTPRPIAARAPVPPGGGDETETETDAPVRTAVGLAAASSTLDELHRALESFEDCALKQTATNLVFGDGGPDARVVLIGEAPGADEDRQGVPFVGQSGQLLNRMLASIGLERTDVFISNTVFWRPPGNRNPTTAEIAACLPFVERIVELVDPELLIALGGAAAKSLLGIVESVGQLRRRWLSYSTPRLARPVPTKVTYHPAYLLRSPGQKRAAWHDMIEIKRKLAEL
ncbi:MAG: uracil-DNA glycosylase family protein [Rhodospirillales bacterium]|jgi:DNA polymerase|nr:uracil-DNA glycosylase family protein [Rhodospirillales bacterium]MDP6804039.1 uracil-DNA glycosylase family protein [Rhodospirillales bacterium]